GTRPWAHPVPWWTEVQRAAAHRKAAAWLPDDHPARLVHLVEAGEPPDVIVAEGREVTAALLAAGHRSKALRLGRTLLNVARTGGDIGSQLELLGLLTAAAVDLQEPEAIATVLYEVDRTVGAPERVGHLGGLLRSALYAQRREGERALSTVHEIPPLPGAHLEFTRQLVRFRAALVGTAADRGALLDELVLWAADRPEAKARIQGFLGLDAYRRGDYRRAADLHLQAVAQLRGPQRSAALMNAAASLLDLWDLDGAAKAAQAAIAVARRHRMAGREAHATWTARSIAYRQERAERPRLALVEAASTLDAPAAALLALSESAFAWRLGEWSTAHDLAMRSRSLMERLRMDLQTALTRCYLEYLDPGLRPELALEDALGIGVPDVRLQALGLLRAAHPGIVDHAHLRALAAPFPAHTHHRRLDLISVAEAVGDSPLPRMA
ncbi:MAG: hypothetical protein ACI8PZ_005951, partial [Myxococcota bacterium]